jgi:hypothetical protein
MMADKLLDYMDKYRESLDARILLQEEYNDLSEKAKELVRLAQGWQERAQEMEKIGLAWKERAESLEAELHGILCLKNRIN